MKLSRKIKTSFSIENHSQGVVVIAVCKEYSNDGKPEIVGKTISRIAVTDEVINKLFFDGKNTNPQIMFAVLKSVNAECFKIEVSARVLDSGLKVIANGNDFSLTFAKSSNNLYSICAKLLGKENCTDKTVASFVTKCSNYENHFVGNLVGVTDSI